MFERKKEKQAIFKIFVRITSWMENFWSPIHPRLLVDFTMLVRDRLQMFDQVLIEFFLPIWGPVVVEFDRIQN